VKKSGYQRCLYALAQDGTAGSEEKVLDELLCESRGSARAVAFHIFLGGDFDLAPIEAVMQVEAGILGGDDSVLEIQGNLIEWNEPVTFLIGIAVQPGLPLALTLHRCSRRVNPSRCHKQQHSQEPKKHQPGKDPYKSGSDEALAKWILEARRCGLAHIPEYWHGRVAAYE
jgi:hypothetical protein